MTRRRRRSLVAAGVAIAAGALVLGIALGSAVLDAPERDAAPAAKPRDRGDTPAGWVRHRDDLTGVSLAYPPSWSALPAREEGVRLIASDGRGGSLLVRTADAGQDVAPGDVESVKRYTDQAVMANRSVRLITEPRQVKLGGLPGWVYVYTFDAGRRRGTHSHYIVFRGRRMFALVLQALPKSRFETLAPVFDRIAGSFRAAT